MTLAAKGGLILIPSQYPHRSEAHRLEEMSERNFRNALPRDWTCEKPSYDYGVNLRVDIFEMGDITGLELLIQLKASAHATEGDTEVVRMRTATYNHLWSKLQVAVLVRFVEPVNDAYWLVVKDIQPPHPGQKTLIILFQKKIGFPSWIGRR